MLANKRRARPVASKFLQAYDALPPDAQHLLVRKHLAPLLDVVSKDRRNRVTSNAADMHHRFARMPTLNLKAKKAEIAALLLELSYDSKRAVIKERSRKEQLLSEAVDSLAQWLNDIWKVAFEFRTNFVVAHACLLYACEALDQIGNVCGGCKCFYASMFIPVRITRSTGKVVRSFMLDGAHGLEKVMLWIWRDLFITILATGTKRQRTIVPDMIDDIRILLGWRALEQLLRGGTKACCTDAEEDDPDNPAACEITRARRWPDIVDDDDDEDYISDDRSSICDALCSRAFYAAHWSCRIADQQPSLRDLVHNALLDIFKVAPSGPVYSSMIAIADDEFEMEEELHPLLMAVAGHSSDNLCAALRIVALNNRSDSIDTLLKAHKHLLRPQDAASVQFAVLIMSSNLIYRTHVMSILEDEILDVSKVFHAAIRFCFCNISSEINKTELTQILALRRHSLNRRTRVEQWVKSVLTPQVDNPFPMALAAFMMGIPLPPGAEGPDEGDMLGYFEVDGDDLETEDLREEFRPNIKARFQGWVETATAIRGGPALVLKLYTKIITDMPFLRASDVAEEMCARLADRPSKLHVSDALDAFRDFCEKQSKTIAATRREASRVAAGTGRTGASRSGLGSAMGSVRTPSVPQVTPSTSSS